MTFKRTEDDGLISPEQFKAWIKGFEDAMAQGADAPTEGQWRQVLEKASLIRTKPQVAHRGDTGRPDFSALRTTLTGDLRADPADHPGRR